MTIENLFETATRQKVRFSFRGVISVEDLWDLNEEQLDSIYKTLNAQVKNASEESLLQKKTKADEELELQIEIVKHIFSVKQAEKQAKLQAREIKAEKQRLMEILASRKEQELLNKSPEELEAMIAALDAK